eukprot:GHVR01059051.1.p1 GENE.GHVR01059051.1~~GHVR01059051.1.p1  ORF type:complete len:150 (+),score=12.53 GHVR01059051.1:1897-2346(+)
MTLQHIKNKISKARMLSIGAIFEFQQIFVGIRFSNKISCSRMQIPLTLAFAITIHKCQGMTLEQVVLDNGEKEWAAGLSFVALSRCTSLEGLVLWPKNINTLNFGRWQKIGGGRQISAVFNQRIKEDLRLKNMSNHGVRDSDGGTITHI